MAQTQQPLGFSGSPMTAAILGPDILARQLRMQQEAQYGQQMLQEGQQTPQGQMVSGHFVPPSWTQYLANGLKSYVGRKAMNDLPNQMASLGQAQMQGVNNLFGVSAPQASAQAPQDLSQPESFAGGASGTSAVPSSQAFPVGPSGAPPAGAGIASGSPDPSSAGIVASPQMLAQGLSAQPGALSSTQSSVSPQNQAMVGALRGQQPGQPRMPLLPGKTAQESAQAFALLGPQGYMQAVIAQGAPTDIVKNMIAMGIDPNSQMGRQIIAANVNKANYIAPTNVRPGGTVFDNVTGKPIFTAPNANGSQIVRDANGNPSMSQVPGAQAVNVNNSVANATGPATFRTQTINNPDGTNVLTTDRAIGEQVQNQPAPLRNNNPGALMPGGKMAQYPDMQSGLIALDNNLQSYGKQGVNTLAGVITKWAPPNENNTKAYIADASQRLGLDPNQKIDLSNPLVRHAISTAIALHESGPAAVFGGAAQPAPQTGAQPGVQGGIAVQGEGTIAANTELGKDQAKTLIDSRKAAISATDDLTNIGKERQALAGGTFGGMGAQGKLNAVKFIQSWVPGLGNLDASKVTNTDYLVSVLGKGLLTHAKDLGYNPTDADATRIEAIIGTIGKDPQALNRLVDYQEMMANRVVQRHNMLVGQMKQNGVQTTFDMSVSPKTGMPGTQEFKMVGGAQERDPSAGFKIIGVR